MSTHNEEAAQPSGRMRGGKYNTMQGNFSTVSEYDRVRSALFSISPDIGRDDWIKAGIAVKDALGDAGFSVWDEWSQGGANYKKAEMRRVWDKFQIPGAVTAGTLFDMAKANGWNDPGRGEPVPRVEPDKSKADKARREAERKQAEAAGLAAEIYQKAKPVIQHPYLADHDPMLRVLQHPYLDAKGVLPVEALRVIEAAAVSGFGGKIAKAGPLLLWPIYSEAGALLSLQAIDAHGNKSLLAGAKKSGGFLCVPGSESRVYLVEGLVTGLSVHQATGAAVYVAIDAGNLKHVAGIVRRRLPDADIVIAGDFDESGAGQKAAGDAAAICSGRVCLPDFGGGYGDWNDLHKLAGLAEVTRQLTQTETQTVNPPALLDVMPDVKRARARRDGEESRYFVTDEFTYYRDDEGKAVKLAGPIRVLDRVRTLESTEWSAVLELRPQHDTSVNEWVCPDRLLRGDCLEFERELVDRGVWVSYAKGTRLLLAGYINQAAWDYPDPARIVKKPGWIKAAADAGLDAVNAFGWSYVLPDAAITPPDGERFRYMGHVDQGHGQRGTVDEWINSIGRYCVGNSRLTLAVSMAFGSALVTICGADNGGVHFTGQTSVGKSTAQYAAVSVMGPPKYKRSWLQTKNALEGTATAANDGLLVLDEIAQAGNDLGESIYMLGNGEGKGRGLRTAEGNRPTKEWSLLVLSSGERTIAEYITDTGGKVRGGQEVRLVDVPADTGT